jgi:hypothetical protein
VKKIITNWGGEFGWFLMRYQGIFRAIKHKNPNTKIVMVSRPGLQEIVNDYIDEYISYDYGQETDGWRLNGKTPLLDKEILIDYPGYTYIDPTICMRVGIEKQKFIKYGNKEHSAWDIVIHARSTTKGETDIRNWSEENWRELVGKLGVMPKLTGEKVYKMCTIGSTEGSIEMHGHGGCLDYRGANLSQVIDIISNAKLVIGPSSGPMHLASLCSTPHLYWTDTKYWGSCGGTNRYRYEVSWNPLGTKSFGIDQFNWQPPVDVVYNEIINALKWVKQNK